MTAPYTELDGVVLEAIDPEQGRVLLDQEARKYFYMSGEDFARACCAGEINTDDSSGLMVSMLLPMAGIWCDDWTNTD